MIRPDCPISGTHDYGMHRLARAYVRADARALRRFTVAIAAGGSAEDDPRYLAWAESAALADRLARIIAGMVRPGNPRWRDASMARRITRVTLGLER